MGPSAGQTAAVGRKPGGPDVRGLGDVGVRVDGAVAIKESIRHGWFLGWEVPGFWEARAVMVARGASD